ncbi:hypothetical protein HMPREF2880_00135 [Neisseria sp. HMSC067G11]|jgi:hypothetical protein|uniref:Uncharacterized protein n=1 Tax=Neisseria subflava NJ9703 TaxID=546268 RepID=A0A9W5IQH2_NEISU|nr:hypothetical protein [Neisseria sp. HMSC067G12]EFC51856.1 hypothetical protein NEISUBOT_04560 [Neisseria subflava NJ9703]OFK01871.1 hypothetical protein HMPREF2834_02715 [Neisseria sp. HMSC067H04]OFK17019.1 hypothetical protein HMPREF2828_01135 [Neisseria sp. HMSC071A01]OFL25033.1 hypothetical protein HMPREF2778_02170 [Neisseria sp. HMSC075C12]OFM32688.1 hypothetical protein HMPREF2696_02090 [Neisseria sp. HMSC058F07]OFN23635.1 hypothetical protein HMPREF2601_00130 [Neisseria sp. HMSC072B1
MEQSTGNKWCVGLYIFLIGMAERKNDRKKNSRLPAGKIRCCLRFKQRVTDFFILMGSNQKAV